MAVILPSGYAQIVLGWTSPNFVSGGAATVLGLGHTDPPWSPLIEVVDAVVAEWVEHLQPVTDQQTQLAYVYAQDDTSSIRQEVGLSGTQNINALPANSAALWSATTSFKGPRGRGRNYWPSLVAANQVAETGLITPGRIAQLEPAMVGFRSGVRNELSTNWVLLQGDEGTSAPISPPPPVTGYSLQPRLATQRRRLRR